ncbi:gp16 family protein [Laribacter hongkongensis]|uniref:DUF1018 domain containing protein n=1 Tax=Laribacter hongkongensis TaxID=168471 RepID=A0A248LI49_9NEIS|nr:regulatory protein GemA [Laribacter hongkongensis]ASJ24134.1 DUF1018 domain containing protein [Laribacter hongkongensis]MCG9060281.1 regulatory protein GemA [Laribacter hongkongensis]MCG9087335.1 regulatory protein GemA [Laribacter hongkongensis]MCG9090244.1 regulatory protein GemA [Laribacter hongkongensis]MCG9111113.1 regulatory protein GemA [Laribacter hongkongensis]
MDRATLAKIHIAKKDLGMDDDTYRAMLTAVAGVSSSRDLDDKAAAKVLRHLRRCGWKPAFGQRPHAARSREALLGKVEALLADGGKHWNYAHGMARKMFGIDQVHWLDDEQLHKLVAALTYHAKRQEVRHD